MAMFCRKRSYAASPPAGEVTVKRSSSCPQSCKPVLPQRRHRERLLFRIFRNTKPGKRIYRGKWKSYDDVRPRPLTDQQPGALPLIEEGSEIFDNPVYLPPGDETPLCSQPMDSLALPNTPNKALDHPSSASPLIQDPGKRREEVTELTVPTHQEPRELEVPGQPLPTHQETQEVKGEITPTPKKPRRWRVSEQAVATHQEPRTQEISGQTVPTHQEPRKLEVSGQPLPTHQETRTQEVKGEITPTPKKPRRWRVSEQAVATHQEPRTQEILGQTVPTHQEPKAQILGQTVPAHQEPSLFERLMRKGSYRQRQKGSKFVHTQPLYQDYCVHYTKGGPGQSPFIHSVNSSLALADNTSPTLPRSYSSDGTPRLYTSSLWQELPEVKERGITKTMTMQRKQLQEAMFEVVVSEASYQRSLSVVINHFQKSKSLSDCLVTSDKHTLFSNLPSVCQVSERFLLDLEEGLEKDVFLRDLGDRVLRHCSVFHRVYIPYVTNQMYQEKLMQQLVRENGTFLQVLQQLEEQPVCKRQPLKSFLALPFQRITRLKILLENILKLAQSDFRLVSSIGDAASAVGQIVTQCDEGVRRMMQTEELVLLEKHMDFQNTKAVPLISRGRVLIQHGELIRIFFQDPGSGHRSGLTTKPIYLHLFSDLLLLSNKTDTGRFLVTDYARRGRVTADHVKAKALGLPSDLVFLLRLAHNHLGLSCDIVLQAPSEEEKEDWIAQITWQMSQGAES
ncbi:rho guanine nucleotide exchange factor 19-like [Rana temporaria]|uniref:rho guanine nucleotide exchange factor 19-like n=1 Tax=Rana temporaria TaxID=8407 RepID=UPI001AADBE4D|nr:rho guanine nucleotide exchange factor 19-like [Rana temporaria]